MDSAPDSTFYLTRRGALSGPFALQVLQRLVSAGEIGADDRVRAEGAREWVRAADHPVLASELAARAELLAQLDSKPAARFAVTLPPTALPRIPKPGALVGGRYRIESRLGEGGMGQVLAAENVLTKKKVALKWLRPELAGDSEARRRFINEARLASRIAHPSVIDIYDVVEDEGPFLVMEHLEGEPLSTLLARKALSRVELLRVLLHAMEGVAAAHKQGVVHRDLKPDNVFVCTDSAGRPVNAKVLDFGISKAAAQQREDTAQTAIGALLGTPYYVPPEQLGHARHVDHRADVYALGVILYECLTGKLPYESLDLPKLLSMIHEGRAVSPRVRDASIPEEVAAIVMKALAPRPADRFASVEALQLALAPFVDEARASVPVTSSAPAPSVEQPALEATMTYVRAQPRRPRAVVAAALVGIALGLGALIGALRLITGAPEAATESVVVEQAPASRASEPQPPASLAAASNAAPSTRTPPPSGPAALPAAPAALPALRPSPARAPAPATEAASEPETMPAGVAPASATATALAELRRAARQCGQGEPNTLAELHVDAQGRLSSLRVRTVEPETLSCLERAARLLAFGASAAPRVLSLSLSLRAARAASASPVPATELPTPAAAASAHSAPPPLVNPYHR